MPLTSVRSEHYEMIAGVCLSVHLSVMCLDLTREWKGLGSPKIGMMEAYHTGNP